MKIIPIAILLIFTLLIVPLVSYFFGTPPGATEWEALHKVLVIAAGAALATFVIGELTGNNSQVDKIWSIMPIVYAWLVADYGDYSPRLVLMSILVTIWGIRLTANFALKGAYQWKFWGGEEDYRWQILRKRPEFNPRWKWTLFNLFFISGYQNMLILLFTLPTVVALQFNHQPLDAFDFAVAGFMLFFIGFEAIADIQHWKFQSRKKKFIHSGQVLTGDYKRGFLSKGLWALSRHPNYFAEQAIWISFYLFSVVASGQWLNWSIAGCLLLVLLFQGSSGLGEEISASKYPEYKEYQKRVPRLVPFFKLKSN